MDIETREKLKAERAELQVANEAATGWGAAVGVRLERIREIDRALGADLVEWAKNGQPATPPLEPGWLAKEVHRAHMTVMLNHSFNDGPYPPISDEEACELFAMMNARFMSWTGKPLSDFVEKVADGLYVGSLPRSTGDAKKIF